MASKRKINLDSLSKPGLSVTPLFLLVCDYKTSPNTVYLISVRPRAVIKRNSKVIFKIVVVFV
jgi:hypothetical protein